MRYSTLSYLLLLTAGVAKGEEVLPTSYFWFDQSPSYITVQQESSEIQLDVSDLSEGLHILNHVAVTPDGRMTPPVSSTFLKLPDIYSHANIDCYAIVDNFYSIRYEGSISHGNVHLNLDMSTLSEGIHQLTVYLNKSGTPTIIGPATTYFLKAPQGGNGFTQYRYWINNDFENARTTECRDSGNTLNIAIMVDVPEYPIRTEDYDMSIAEDGGIRISARNIFNLFAMDESGRFTPAHTAIYTDHRTSRHFPLNTIEELSTCVDKNTGSIDEGEIKWFRFYGETGDSIALNLSDRAMYELYSPTAKLMLKNKSSLAKTLTTKVLNETGIHYLAIHDIASSIKDRLKLNFFHIPRNAILKVTPPEIPEPYAFTKVDIYGNGMKAAKKVIFIPKQGDAIETTNITPYDNYNLACVLDKNQNLKEGTYDVAILVDDEFTNQEGMVIKEKALTVTKPSVQPESHNEITVDVIPSKRPSTPYMVDIVITNRSDEPCWGIPFNIACERNGGQTGYVFYMRDFLGYQMDISKLNYIETDNVLGTGVDGLYFPLVIDYMQPHESRTLKVGISSNAHEHIGLYVWTGEPYSREHQRLLSLCPEELYDIPVTQTNIMSTLYGAYILEVAEKIDKDYMQTRQKSRAKTDDNHVLEIIQEVTPEILGQFEHLETPTNYASKLSDLSQAQGKTFAGICNAGGSMRAYQYFKDNHIPGETLREQLENIDLMYSSGIPPEFMPYYLEAKRNMARAASPGEIVEDATDIPFIGCIVDYFTKRNASCQNPPVLRNDIECLQSFDPNAISGQSDLTGGPYIGLEVKGLRYEVEFENDPEKANASAIDVSVKTDFDQNVFDLTTFIPQSIEIGNKSIPLSGEQNFVKTIDMRPDIPCIVEVSLDYSCDSGKALWSFKSLDPITLEPVEDSRQGFLPVNDSTGAGTGRIEYMICLKDGLSDNTKFSHKATIVFDSNEAIETPEWINITDYERPSSRLTETKHEEGSNDYTFTVGAEDNGSGILSYDLYARMSPKGNWFVVKPAVTDMTVTYSCEKPMENPEFMVLATDRAGNRQLKPEKAESGIMTTICPPDENETWYDIHGIRQRDPRPSLPKILISTKGRKVIVK